MRNERVRFGEILRGYRIEADLTQADLAQLAGIGLETIGALERGVNNRPRKSTVERLSEALGLGPEERTAFEAYARPRPRAQHRAIIRGKASNCPGCPYSSATVPTPWGM